MREHRYCYPTVIELRRVVAWPSRNAIAIDPRLGRAIAAAQARTPNAVTRQAQQARAAR